MQKRKPTKRMLSRKLRHHNASVVLLPVLTVRKTMIKLLKLKKYLWKTTPQQRPKPYRRPYPTDLPITPPPSIAQTMENTLPVLYKKNYRRTPPIFSLALLLKKITSIRWFLLIMFLYFTVGVTMIFFQQGISPFKETIIYSIMGFSTFFMSYIGWVIAQDIIKIINRKKIIS
ncbi:MAG: hypothetical protein QXL17_05040 [Candidatus Thermoplasmatota archaeon]